MKRYSQKMGFMPSSSMLKHSGTFEDEPIREQLTYTHFGADFRRKSFR